MKVKSLLARAAKCKTDDDAQDLLFGLKEAFGTKGPLSHLYQTNDDWCIEDEGPFVRFELNQLINEHYITMIRPEIREGKLAVVVVTNHMLDGLGMSSQSWEVVDRMYDVIEAYDDNSVAQIARQAKELAIANHAQLIESVGVPTKLAKQTAIKSW